LKQKIFNFFNKKNKISSFEIGKIRLGEQSLLYKEYTGYSDYSGGTFPSGLVKNINYFKIKIDCKFNDKFRIFLNIDNENFTNTSNEISLKFGFNFHNDFSKELL
jgi:hypothetical protein